MQCLGDGICWGFWRSVVSNERVIGHPIEVFLSEGFTSRVLTRVLVLGFYPFPKADFFCLGHLFCFGKYHSFCEPVNLSLRLARMGYINRAKMFAEFFLFAHLRGLWTPNNKVLKFCCNLESRCERIIKNCQKTQIHYNKHKPKNIQNKTVELYTKTS